MINPLGQSKRRTDKAEVLVSRIPRRELAPRKSVPVSGKRDLAMRDGQRVVWQRLANGVWVIAI